MAKLNDPTGIFEIQPRHAAYIVVADQLELVRKAIDNHKVLSGYFKQRTFLTELSPRLTGDPIQLAQMISTFSALEGVLEQYLMGVLAFGLLTTDKQSELENLGQKYNKDGD